MHAGDVELFSPAVEFTSVAILVLMAAAAILLRSKRRPRSRQAPKNKANSRRDDPPTEDQIGALRKHGKSASTKVEASDLLTAMGHSRGRCSVCWPRRR